MAMVLCVTIVLKIPDIISLFIRGHFNTSLFSKSYFHGIGVGTNPIISKMPLKQLILTKRSFVWYELAGLNSQSFSPSQSKLPKYIFFPLWLNSIGVEWSARPTVIFCPPESKVT